MPAGPFTPGALVQIFVDDTALDLQGNRIFPYSGQLTIDADPLTSPPQVLAVSPFQGQTNGPTNAVAEVLFSEPLDATTVTSANIAIRNSSSVVVPGTITLLDGGRTVRLVPNASLAANQSFHVHVTTGLRDLQNAPVQIHPELLLYHGSGGRRCLAGCDSGDAAGRGNRRRSERAAATDLQRNRKPYLRER